MQLRQLGRKVLRTTIAKVIAFLPLIIVLVSFWAEPGSWYHNALRHAPVLHVMIFIQAILALALGAWMHREWVARK